MSFYQRHSLQIFLSHIEGPVDVNIFVKKISNEFAYKNINGLAEQSWISVCHPSILDSTQLDFNDHIIFGCFRTDYKVINTKILNSRISKSKKEVFGTGKISRKKKNKGQKEEILEAIKEAHYANLLKETKVSNKFSHFLIKFNENGSGYLYTENTTPPGALTRLAESIGMRITPINLMSTLSRSDIKKGFTAQEPQAIRQSLLNYIFFKTINDPSFNLQANEAKGESNNERKRISIMGNSPREEMTKQLNGKPIVLSEVSFEEKQTNGETGSRYTIGSKKDGFLAFPSLKSTSDMGSCSWLNEKFLELNQGTKILINLYKTFRGELRSGAYHKDKYQSLQIGEV